MVNSTAQLVEIAVSLSVKRLVDAEFSSSGVTDCLEFRDSLCYGNHSCIEFGHYTSIIISKRVQWK